MFRYAWKVSDVLALIRQYAECGRRGPTYDDITFVIGASRSTVARILNHLDGKELRIERGGGRGRCNRYHIKGEQDATKIQS